MSLNLNETDMSTNLMAAEWTVSTVARLSPGDAEEFDIEAFAFSVSPDYQRFWELTAEYDDDWMEALLAYEEPAAVGQEVGSFYARNPAKVDTVGQWIEETLQLSGLSFSEGLAVAGAVTDTAGAPEVNRLTWMIASQFKLRLNLSLDADDLSAALLNLPLPVFSSPPSGWKTLNDLASKGPFVAIAALASTQDQPLLAVVSGTTGFVVWFTKPQAEALRDHVTRALKRKLRSTRKED
jgi:hypothetical protein